MAVETHEARFVLRASGEKEVESAFGRVNRAMGDVQRVAGLAGAALGSGVLAAQAAEMVKIAAAAEQRARGFERLAGSHGMLADQVLRDLERMSGGTIASAVLMEKAGTAMLMGIPAERMSELMEIARASSRITGAEVSKSFEDIVLAVARQSREILDNLGIVVRAEDAYKDYAGIIGKSSSQLTDAEKKQAFMNATLTAGQDIVRRVGVDTVDAAESMQRYAAEVQNLKESFGGLFIGDTLVSGIGSVAESVNGLNWLLRDTKELLDKIEIKTPEPESRLGRLALSSGRFSMTSLMGPTGNMIALLGRYGAMRESMEGEGPDRFPFPGRFNAATGRYEPFALPASDSPGGSSSSSAKPRGTPASFFQDAANRAAEEIAFEGVMSYRVGFNPLQNTARPDGTQGLGFGDFDIASFLTGGEARAEADAFAAERFAALQTSMASERDLIQSEYWERQSIIEQARMADQENHLVYAEAQIQLEQWKADRLREVGDQEVRDRLETEAMKFQAAQNTTSALMNLTNALYTFSGQKSRQLFELNKVAGIADATVSTYTAAANALRSVPYPFNIAAAAAVTAAGLARVAAISSTNFGGGAAAGGYGRGTPDSPIVTQPGFSPQGQGAQEITIRVIGVITDAVVEEELIPRINSAGTRNVKIEYVPER